MKGSKFVPTELKLLRMTAKKAEQLTKKITPTSGPLEEAPDWLTPEQKAEWDYAIANAPREVLRKADRTVLAGFIVAADLHRQAALAVQKSQLLVKSPNLGVPIQNPYLPILNRQMLLMMRAASELGFTPCSRARIDAGKPPKQESDSDWDEIATG